MGHLRPWAGHDRPRHRRSLGREEIRVGEFVVTDVLPQFSKGRVNGEDRGIAAGAVMRPKTVSSLPPRGSPPPPAAAARRRPSEVPRLVMLCFDGSEGMVSPPDS